MEQLTSANTSLEAVVVDGNVTTSDSAFLLQYAAEKTELSAEAQASADVNGDGVADTNDAAVILQYAAEQIASF